MTTERAADEELPQEANRATLAIMFVGASMLLVYFFESFVQSYELLYLPYGASGPLASLHIFFFGGPLYDSILPWQATVFQLVVPFLLFFWAARRMRLNPFRFTLPTAIPLFLWGCVLALLGPFLTAYAEHLVLPRYYGALPSSALAAELAPLPLAGVVSEATIFLMLGFTAMAFAYFWSDRPLWNFRGWLEAEYPPYSEEDEDPDQPEAGPSELSLSGS